MVRQLNLFRLAGHSEAFKLWLMKSHQSVRKLRFLIQFHKKLVKPMLALNIFHILTFYRRLKSEVYVRFFCLHIFSFVEKSNCVATRSSLLSVWTPASPVCRCQFHPHFTHNFYAHRSRKNKKDSQLKQLFTFLESAGVKAAHKHVDEIDPIISPLKKESTCHRQGSTFFFLQNLN